ncbi:MAG: hypothetical protein M3011_08115, partial [Actinomycetota bacterium]|nr:hypothetical protein [Actinomycetota bacterium]
LIRPPDPFGKCSAPPTMTLHGGDDGEPSFVLWTSGGTPAKDFLGVVVVAHADLVRTSAGDAGSVASRDLTVYVQANGGPRPAPHTTRLDGWWVDGTGMDHVPVLRQIPADEITLAKRGDDWVMLTVHAAQGFYLASMSAERCPAPC